MLVITLLVVGDYYLSTFSFFLEVMNLLNVNFFLATSIYHKMV